MLEILLTLSLAQFILTELGMYGHILDWARKPLVEDSKFLKKLFSCRLCFSFWTTLATIGLFRMESGMSGSILLGLATWAGGYLLGALKDKIAPCPECSQSAGEFKVTR